MARRVMLAAMVLVVAACSSDEATTTTEARGTRPPVETTTTVPAETTTTVPAETTTTAVAIIYAPELDAMGTPEFPPVLGSPGDPNGSGCVVPAGDTLPDGIWFGYVRSYVDAVIGLDLACFFTGAAAAAAMAEDGLDDEFAEEGWYIRNQLPKVYDAPLAAAVDVYFIDFGSPGGLFPEALPLADWPSASSFLCAPPLGDNCMVWLHINGGTVTAIVEQFAP